MYVRFSVAPFDASQKDPVRANPVTSHTGCKLIYSNPRRMPLETVRSLVVIGSPRRVANVTTADK